MAKKKKRKKHIVKPPPVPPRIANRPRVKFRDYIGPWRVTVYDRKTRKTIVGGEHYNSPIITITERKRVLEVMKQLAHEYPDRERYSISADQDNSIFVRNPNDHDED